MIHIKTIRLANPLFGGSNTIRSTEAEILLNLENTVVYIKKVKAPRTEYIVSLATVEHMEPLAPMTVFTKEPTPEQAAAFQEGMNYLEKKVDPFKTLHKSDMGPPESDDKVRMVKINGMIVERKGEKKPDEIEALEYAALEREEFNKKNAIPSKPKAKKPTSISEMLESTRLGAAEEE